MIVPYQFASAIRVIGKLTAFKVGDRLIALTLRVASIICSMKATRFCPTLSPQSSMTEFSRLMRWVRNRTDASHRHDALTHGQFELGFGPRHTASSRWSENKPAARQTLPRRDAATRPPLRRLIRSQRPTPTRPKSWVERVMESKIVQAARHLFAGCQCQLKSPLEVPIENSPGGPSPSHLAMGRASRCEARTSILASECRPFMPRRCCANTWRRPMTWRARRAGTTR